MLESAIAITPRNAEIETILRQAIRRVSAAVDSVEKSIRDSRTKITEARQSIDEANAVLARDRMMGGGSYRPATITRDDSRMGLLAAIGPLPREGEATLHQPASTGSVL